MESVVQLLVLGASEESRTTAHLSKETSHASPHTVEPKEHSGWQLEDMGGKGGSSKRGKRRRVAGEGTRGRN